MGLGQFLLEQIEGRTGLTLRERAYVDELEGDRAAFRLFKEEAEELAYHTLNYFDGKPQDMRPEQRQRLSQRSRIALMVDPLAGAEGDLKANFALGRGVPMPKAADDNVQKVIEEAWTDPVNSELLTSFEAQQHRSRELLAQANLLPAAFVKGGRVRVAFLDPDRVREIIPDPENEERPLYYVTHPSAMKQRAEWNAREHRWESHKLAQEDERKAVYWKHWRNIEDVEEEVKSNSRPKLPAKMVPLPADTAEGLVYHCRINRIGRTQWGTPPFARTLRWFSAMNELLDAHVAMAQARSTFIAKRTRIGNTPQQILSATNAILTQTGEIGAAKFGESSWGHGGPPPPPPGSFWASNEGDTLESLNLSSGAGEMSQSAQIVRSPIAAASGFQQGYLGDAQNAGSLASATALELPTLMAIQAWQETLEGLLRWFVDLVIREAVRSGRLGDRGPTGNVDKALSELQLQEAEEKKEAEARTGKKLDYSLAMPYPGRRQLPEVVTSVSGILTAVPSAGRSPAFLRRALTFLFTHGWQLDDPEQAVEECLEEMQARWEEEDAQAEEDRKFSSEVQKVQLEQLKTGGAAAGGPGSGGLGASGAGERKTSSGGAMSEGTVGGVAVTGLAFDALWEEEVERRVLGSANGALG